MSYARLEAMDTSVPSVTSHLVCFSCGFLMGIALNSRVEEERLLSRDYHEHQAVLFTDLGIFIATIKDIASSSK